MVTRFVVALWVAVAAVCTSACKRTNKAVPEVQVLASFIHVGTVFEGSPIQGTFQLTNVGAARARILLSDPPCGGTAEPTSMMLLPGQGTSVTVSTRAARQSSSSAQQF